MVPLALGVSAASVAGDIKLRLTPEAVRREIESQMGRAVDYRCERQFSAQRGDFVTRVIFAADGRGAWVALDERDLELPIAEFSKRIVAPLVARWQDEATA